jgi:tRNA threonylcarbamoyl adenosine modification protein (Sua5/YciO/YrdC/YwlC family)
MAWQDGTVPPVFDCRDPASRRDPVDTTIAQVQRGRIAVVPDQAMYVLLADAFSDYGVNRLRITKGRDDTPFTVLVGAQSTVTGIAAGVPSYAHDLMQALWPGPLTLILRQQPTLAWPLTAPSVSVRMPLHPLLLDVVRGIGPTASTSANRAGLRPALSAADALDQFDSDADLHLDVGDIPPGGPRSTIVDATGEAPIILRDGAFDADRIAAVCPALEIRPG